MFAQWDTSNRLHERRLPFKTSAVSASTQLQRKSNKDRTGENPFALSACAICWPIVVRTYFFLMPAVIGHFHNKRTQNASCVSNNNYVGNIWHHTTYSICTASFRKCVTIRSRIHTHTHIHNQSNGPKFAPIALTHPIPIMHFPFLAGALYATHTHTHNGKPNVSECARRDENANAHWPTAFSQLACRRVSVWFECACVRVDFFASTQWPQRAGPLSGRPMCCVADPNLATSYRARECASVRVLVRYRFIRSAGPRINQQRVCVCTDTI